MEVFSRANELEAEGREVIHLEFGEPDFQAPAVALEALQQSLAAHPAGYTVTQGTLALREAICRKYQRDYGVAVRPERVLVSGGSSVLLFLAIRLLAPPGSEVLITDPGYACYDNLVHLAEVTPVRVPLRHEDGFQLDPDAVRQAITSRTRALLLNSPTNPTGVVFRPEILRELTTLGIPVISDEIYADLSYGSRPQSILEFTEEAIALNGFSKYYAMTGWRLGYLIAPDSWMPGLVKMHQNLMISTTHFVQDAGVRVLDEGGADCERMKVEFDRRRQFLLEKFRVLGLDPGYDPTGAFYVFLKYRNPKKSLELALEILEKTGVALTPGVDFGQGGEGFLRFSYANSAENLGIAVDRLVESGLL
jgi:aspartate/methionine/tyrosine aminotransferase